MNKKFFLLTLFLIAPFCIRAEQQPDSLAAADHPRPGTSVGSHGAGVLPEIYGLKNDWRSDLPSSHKAGDTIKKGNAFYELDMMQWMPPGCPSCRKSSPKACL